MDILTYAKQLESRMKERLEELNTGEDELHRFGQALTCIREIIADLRQFASTYKFASEVEEIKFFKEVKPVFLSQYFYYKNAFGLKLLDSFKETGRRKENYDKVLRQMGRFVQKNLPFYEYCLSNATHRDRYYFTRHYLSHLPDRDEKFSTGYDIKLAKILAYELLKRYVLDQATKARVETVHGLKWTGAKTDLIELIYALHGADVFNHGDTSIKSIASAFENVFQITLGDYYRTFQDMRIRKKSQSPFLDNLRDTFIQRINDDG